jgi:membrane protein
VPASGRAPLRFLADHGTSLPWTWALVTLLPLGLYGEGLVRAFSRLSAEPSKRPPVRGRVAAAGAALVVPAALLVALQAVDRIGRHGILLGTYLSFLIAWGLATAALAVAYATLTPVTPRPRALAWGAAWTGSVLAGFGLGFVLFLSFGISIGTAYGGQRDLGTAAIAALWAYGLHAAALAGYALTQGIDEAAALEVPGRMAT